MKKSSRKRLTRLVFARSLRACVWECFGIFRFRKKQKQKQKQKQKTKPEKEKDYDEETIRMKE